MGRVVVAVSDDVYEDNWLALDEELAVTLLYTV